MVAREIYSEILIKEIKNGKVSIRYDKINPSDRNEFWDCEAMQVLGASIVGILSVVPATVQAVVNEDIENTDKVTP